MLPIIRALDEAESTCVGTTWFKRASREAELHLRFESLFQALRAHQATPTVITLAQQTSEDCAKHVDQYLGLAREFGVSDERPVAKRPGPLAPTSLSILERIVYELVALSCIEETLTGCMMGQVYQYAKHPSVRLTAHIVFQDEIWHSRLGWAHLGNLAKQQDLGWISGHVSELIERTLDHELYDLGNPLRQNSHMLSYGELDDDRRLEILREGVNTIILPGLESFGVNVGAGRTWSRTHLGTP